MKIKSRTASDGSDSKKTLPKFAKRKPSGTTISKTNSHASRSKKVSNLNNAKPNLASTDVTK